MERKWFSKKICKVFPKRELIGCLIVRHREDQFLCFIWRIKWFKYTHGYILHSKGFPTTPNTPKSELKRRSYGPDKLDKENYRNRETLSQYRKLCRNRENSVTTKFSVATKNSIMIEKTLSR